MNWMNVRVCVLLVFLTVVVYFRAGGFEFINYDDQDYVTENSVIQDGLTIKGIKWAFSFVENDLTYWHPLAYVAHMLDCQLFGVDPGLHHISNVFLHALNAILLYLTLLFMTGSRYQSAFAACLFAVHPVCVDSVAWISQKKTLLSTFFWLLSLLSYTWYTKKISLTRYALVCSAVVAGLLTKPLMVTFPFILFLFDIWPLNRLIIVTNSDAVVIHKSIDEQKLHIKRLIIEKIPFLFFVVLWGITPFIPKHVTAKNISLDAIPLLLRYKNAVVSYFLYIKNFFTRLIWLFYTPIPIMFRLFQLLFQRLELLLSHMLSSEILKNIRF